MREILFRGKGRDNGKWYEGDLGTVAHKRFIDDGKDNARVIPETVGQYTGLTDKNGKKIFEGDIVKGNEKIFTEEVTFIVVFDAYCRYVIVSSYGCYLLARNHEDVEIIGNIHDNPELLEATK